MTHRSRFRVALIVAAAVTSLPSRGQIPPPAPANEQTGVDEANVHVGDSYEARTALRRADRLAEAKRWREAARAYHQAVERFADKLVRLGPHTYVGTAVHANQRIAAWPEIGLKIYRLLYADRARQRLAAARSARDLPGLLTVMEAYFCTRPGATAGDLAAQLAMEAGDFALAGRLYEQLLARHPDRQELTGELTTKLALTFVWSGRIDRARALLKRVKSDHPQDTLVWAGRSRRLSDVIEEAISRRADPAVGERTFAWPLMGGSAQRNRVARSAVPPGAPLWEYGPRQGFRPITAGPPKPTRQTYGTRRRLARTDRSLVLVPVTDGTSVYLCDAITVWAIRIRDGSQCWPPYSAAPSAGRPTRTLSRNEPSELYTCVLHDDRLFAVLGQPTGPPQRGGRARSGLLTCLDAATGKPVWSTRLAELDARLTGIRLDTAPVFHQDKLFAVGRRRKRFGFEDGYLLRFDADTGRLDWIRHLASASVGSYGLRRATRALVTISEATVYVCTHLGAVAAVNTYDGRIRWLRIYHKDHTEEEAGARYARRVSPWRYAPLICWRDRLVCAPLDSDRVLILNRADGQVVAEIDAGRLGHFQQVLGVVDDVLYTAGRELVAWDLAENDLRWSRSLAGRGATLGRGQVTDSHIYLPMENGFYRFALGGGSPESFDWPENAVGGNVLATPEQIIVAGGDRLTGYAPKDEAFARLQRRIDAAPADPVPLLDLAEVAFRVGERRRGIDALNRAVGVCGGFARIVDPKIKTRVFRDFIHFGDKVTNDELPDMALALKLYGQAAQCPPDMDAQALYRLRLAEAFLATHQFGRAIEQHQQIITDRSLQDRTIRPRDDGQAWLAGEWSERQIDAILSEHGRGPYEPFERRAAAMLAVGREQNDLAAIQRVIDGFPNSRSAREALRTKAQLLEQRGEYRQAVRAYLTALNRGPKLPDAPAIMRRIAEAYLRADRPTAARRWLARAARAFPDHRFDHNGRPIGFAEYRRRVLDKQPGLPPRPRFSLPLVKRWSRTFPGWVWVLRPEHADLPATRWDLYVTHSAGRVQAFTAPGNRALWAQPLACKFKPKLIGMTPERLILVTTRLLFGVDIDSGKVSWSVEARPADADQAQVDPENLRKWVAWTMTEDRVFGVLDDGRTVCVDADGGRVIWRGRLPDGAERQPVADDEFLIYPVPATRGQGPAIHVLDAETGRVVRKIKAGALGRTFWMTISEQGLLLAATGRQLYAFDPYAGTQAWETSMVSPNYRATLLAGPEGLYLSHNGRTLVRRSLQTGKVLGESPALIGLRPGGMVAAMGGDRLFVLNGRSVSALDARTLELRWRGATDRNVNLISQQVGRPYVVAIDQRAVIQGERTQRRFFAYFYDRRDDSGLIPAEGGMIDLGTYQTAREITFADHTLLVVDGQTIHGWTKQ